LALVANGSITVADFILSVANRPEFSARHLNEVAREANPIKSILCDCAGSTIAWLAMAASHVSTQPPWEIYEEYSAITGAFSVTSTVTGASNTYTLSQYIRNAVDDTATVEAIVSTRTRSVSAGGRPQYLGHAQGASRSSVETPLTTDWTQSSWHDSSRNTQSLGGTIEEETSATTLSSQLSTLPRKGHIVELEHEEAPRLDRLRVNDGSRTYTVTLENVLGARRYDAYYLIAGRLSSVFSRTCNQMDLVMLRAIMTKEADAHVEMFVRSIHGVRRNVGPDEDLPGNVLKAFFRRA